MAEFDHDLIDEQIDYYRRRAPEYDGSTTPLDEEFADEGLALDAALAAFLPGGEVLEVACGTGSWTRAIDEYADEVTALDSSPEMIRLARAKVPGAGVRFIEANFFSWRPDREYDAVLFANWLSHVPPALFGDFWMSVGDCLTPGGRVFFIDETKERGGRSDGCPRIRLPTRARLS
jgi:SAM-dependent methyltransferase